VDFLTRHIDGRQELIQVCADLDSAAAGDRKLGTLFKAARKYPKAEFHTVVLSADAARDITETHSITFRFDVASRLWSIKIQISRNLAILV